MTGDCVVSVLTDEGEWCARWFRPLDEGWAFRFFGERVRDAREGATFSGGECASEWFGLRLVSSDGDVLRQWLKPSVQESLF